MGPPFQIDESTCTREWDDKVAPSSDMFRASELGLLALDAPESGLVLGRLVAERGPCQLGPRPLEAAISMCRDFASRSAVLLRRLALLEEGVATATATVAGNTAAPERRGDDMSSYASAAAAVNEVINTIAIDFLALPATLLKHHPHIIDEFIIHRLDDDGPAPDFDRHDEVWQARVAVRAARFSPEQRSALRLAYAAYRRNMEEPLRLWRQAGLQLIPKPDGDCDAGVDDGAPPAPVVAIEVLCDRIECCVGACSLHRALLMSRFFSIVTPRQLAGLLADSFPFVMRPVVLLAVQGILDGEYGQGD